MLSRSPLLEAVMDWFTCRRPTEADDYLLDALPFPDRVHLTVDTLTCMLLRYNHALCAKHPSSIRQGDLATAVHNRL